MPKQLTQIMFDFSAAVEQGDTSAAVSTVINEENIDTSIIAQEKTQEEVEVVLEEKKQIPEDSAGHVAGKRGRRSLKNIALTADLIQIPDDEVLFQKQYYSIGQVAEMFRENQSLIRYWETEFDILEPRKNRKGDRFFRPVDIKNLVLIYDLLRRRKFTIEGAKDYLKKNKKAEEKFAVIQNLEKIKSFLLELKASL